MQFKYKIKEITGLLQLLTSLSSRFAGKGGLFHLPKQVFGVCICTQSGRERYVWCTNRLVLAMQL